MKFGSDQREHKLNPRYDPATYTLVRHDLDSNFDGLHEDKISDKVLEKSIWQSFIMIGS